MARGIKCSASLLIAGLILGHVRPTTAVAGGPAQIRFGGGSEQAVVTVLSWKDGLPELTETRLPDGSTEVRAFDRVYMNSVRWEPEPGSSEGRGQGKIVAAEAGIERTIVVSYRTTAEGLELELADEADPSLRGSAVAIGLDPPRLPGERIGTHHPVFLAIVAVGLCAMLQERAMDQCFEHAVDTCGEGNVDYARYTGYCGTLGECEVDCVND